MPSLPQPPAPARHSAAVTGAVAALLALAIGAAWANSLRGPMVYDDFPSILMNPTIRSLWPLGPALHPPSAGGMTVAGRPILNLSLAIDFALSGPGVWSYHLTNLLIHLAATLACFGVVRRVVRRPATAPGLARCGWILPAGARLDGPTAVAAAVALCWGLHPLQTEAVTYIIQRAESLMGLWYLLTLYAFLRAADSDRPAGWTAAAIGACALGMGTKEVMVSAPVMVLLLDRAFVTGSFREAWRSRRWLHGGLAATWIVLVGQLFSTHGRGDGQFNPGVGWGQYFLTQFGAILHYLRLTAWPRPLIFEYGAQWVPSLGSVLPQAAAVLVLAGSTAIACWRRPRLGFPGLFFFAILAPTSLIPGGRQTLAEHRMYLALLAPVALVVWAAGARLGRAGCLLAAAAAAALGAATARRNADYQSDVRLWGDTVAKRPGNPVAHHNYGMALYEHGQLPAAAEQYRQALAIEPDYLKAHANLGATLLALGEVPAGIAEYRRALAINPNYEDAHFCLAQALAATGDLPEADAEYRRALALVPADRFAHLGLARALAQAGQLDQAIAEAETARQLDPLDPVPYLELGKMLAQAGWLDAATQRLRQALALDPGQTQAREILARIRALH